MSKRISGLFLASLLLLSLVATSGCSYMKKRGNDALDIFDIGFTVTDSAKPDFALYIDFFGRTPLGYAHNTNTKLFGIGARKAGWMDCVNESWGAIAWGSELSGAGPFDPRDPYQAREDQRDLTERPRWNTGFVRMTAEDDAPPALQFAACDKVIHLGYIGFLANCRPLELLDFLAGWTTLDFLHDDDAPYRNK